MAEMKRLKQKFIAGKTKVRYSGGWFDDTEIKAMTAVAQSGWLGSGIVTERFEQR